MLLIPRLGIGDQPPQRAERFGEGRAFHAPRRAHGEPPEGDHRPRLHRAARGCAPRRRAPSLSARRRRGRGPWPRGSSDHGPTRPPALARDPHYG